jgi:hypothetical protein
MQRPRRTRFQKTVLLLGLTLASVPAALASHLAVQLTVEAGGRRVQAETDTFPPPGGRKPRPVLKAHSGDTIRLRWSVKNPDRSKKIEKLLIHLAIVPEAQVGQKEVPDLRKDAVWQTAIATALEPNHDTHGEIELPVSERGVYLIRVESGFTERDHEHFAAVDLQIE